MKEIWKPVIYPYTDGTIEDYTGYYIINNNQEIVNCRTGRKMAKRIGHCEYYLVTLSKKNVVKTLLLHRIMAYAFVPNPNNYSQVNHKDENKLNNYVDIENPNNSNIEWVKPMDNANYGTRNEKCSKKRSIPVLQYDLNGNFIKEWPSSQQIERELGYFKQGICQCLKGKLKTAYGFIWKYK